jgi:hypothetical protein
MQKIPGGEAQQRAGARRLLRLPGKQDHTSGQPLCDFVDVTMLVQLTLTQQRISGAGHQQALIDDPSEGLNAGTA